MVEEDKAKELVEKFKEIEIDDGQMNGYGIFMGLEERKYCALICVEVMINNAKENFKLAQELNHKQSEGLMVGDIVYWKKIKQDINNL